MKNLHIYNRSTALNEKDLLETPFESNSIKTKNFSSNAKAKDLQIL